MFAIFIMVIVILMDILWITKHNPVWDYNLTCVILWLSAEGLTFNITACTLLTFFYIIIQQEVICEWDMYEVEYTKCWLNVVMSFSFLSYVTSRRPLFTRKSLIYIPRKTHTGVSANEEIHDSIDLSTSFKIRYVFDGACVYIF